MGALRASPVLEEIAVPANLLGASAPVVEDGEVADEFVAVDALHDQGTLPLIATGAPRGRSPSWSRTPGASRRSSVAARTPPSLPMGQSSSSSVLPSSPFSPKAASVPVLHLHAPQQASVSASAPAAAWDAGLLGQLLSPASLCSPSPIHPPGFISAMYANASPSSAPVLRTRLCSPTQGLVTPSRQLFATTPPYSSPPATPGIGSQVSSAATPSPSPARGSLFIPLVPALLPTPPEELSPRPAAGANRRKTLAAGYTVRRSSIRIKAGHKGLPIAKMAEQNLCRRLGIVDEQEDVTEEAVQKFIAMFNNQVPSETVAALRALFRLDYARADAVEAALLSHGGQASLDLEVHDDA
ncbi:hypothetical protein ACQ4PT_050733 [Festuca glaucescens]